MAAGNKTRLTVTIVITLITIASWAWGVVLYQSTIISLWIPVAVAAVMTGVTLLPFIDRWQWITQSSNRMLNGACHLLFAGSVAFFMFVGYNYYFADDAAADTQTATVINKYSDERTRYRRVGRRYVPREHYNVYFIVLELPDGTRIKREVPTGTYAKTRRGSQRNVAIHNGALGFSIIKGYSICKPQNGLNKTK